MAGQDNHHDQEVDYNHLIFDWKNPGMSARQTEDTQKAETETASQEETSAAVEEPAESEYMIDPILQVEETESQTDSEKKIQERKIPRKKNQRKPGKTRIEAAGVFEAFRNIIAGKGKWILTGAAVILAAVVVISGIHHLAGRISHHKNSNGMPDFVTEDYLTINSYSRPGIQTDIIRGIVIHYVGNPGTTAKENRDYFEGLAESGETHASSNFIVGLDGEVIAAVPAGEVAYASNNRNMDTISIECCHPEEDGRFTEETYDSLVKLTAWLCNEYQLSTEAVIRHYDITKKLCPKYYVENPDSWSGFLRDVQTLLDEDRAEEDDLQNNS